MIAFTEWLKRQNKQVHTWCSEPSLEDLSLVATRVFAMYVHS